MKKKRSFLKWAGSKFSLVDKIQNHLPEGERLIEPFVGAGSVFLNTHYKEYLLADINHDLIALFNAVKKSPQDVINDAKTLFIQSNNTPDAFYHLRDQFNQSSDDYERVILFLYLNRHCYNGLCRYNQKGIFNVPFGRYVRPYFPEKEILYFSEKAQSAIFICDTYDKIMKKADKNSVIYCDPPYAPLSKTAHFTAYYNYDFSLIEQEKLAKLAQKLTKKYAIPILISNHDTALTRHWYKEAELFTLTTRRFISQNGKKRDLIDEILALFHQK